MIRQGTKADDDGYEATSLKLGKGRFLKDRKKAHHARAHAESKNRSSYD